MRGLSLWREVLDIDDAVIEEVALAGRWPRRVVVVRVRPAAECRGRCGVCRRRCPAYDRGRRRRRWRCLDLGTRVTYLEAEAPRVRCRRHGVVVAHVPWAKHNAGHTHAFDAQVAWLAVNGSKQAVTRMMRIAWRTVGEIVTRYRAAAQAAAGGDGLDGLTRIGIDEISYKRGHKYLTVVVDHDTADLVWAAEGRDKATLHRFFDQLGEHRAGQVSHVSADGADTIDEVLADRCPAAVRCADPFHVVKWANDALNRVRIDAWNDARTQAAAEPKPKAGWARRTQALPGRDRAHRLKRSRLALGKNPEDLTRRQHAKLAWIAIEDPRLYRGYLLKERLRLVFQMPTEDAADTLQAWIADAADCEIPVFVDLARRIEKHRPRILAAIEHQMSNGLIESTNTKIRLLTRAAFGFHNPQALIALALLNLGHHRPTLPDRA